MPDQSVSRTRTNPYTFCISLRLFHPSMGTQVMTDTLRMIPRRTCEAGKPRMTPHGTFLPGLYDSSFWMADQQVGNSVLDDLPAALMEAARRLAQHHAFFQRLRAEGGKVQFYVGWFMNGGAGEDFSAELSGVLASLGIDLALCVYPGRDPQEAQAASE